ncbi:MAG: alanine racemase C-terminal domain-containing protein, partial [Acidimicrobiaceae bacterium]
MFADFSNFERSPYETPSPAASRCTWLTCACSDIAGRKRLAATSVSLLGAQESQAISANEIATRLETIGYEIVCGISARVPRVY